MKKYFLLMCVLFCCFFTNLKAQEITPIDSMQYIYCQIVGTGKFMSNKVNVTVDFGQANKFLSDQRLRDEDGNVVTFNSMVDAMNWMGTKGWEFMQAYVVTITGMGGGQNVYHWLLKKSIKKMSDEERKVLFESFKTKKDFKESKEE